MKSRINETKSKTECLLKRDSYKQGDYFSLNHANILKHSLKLKRRCIYISSYFCNLHRKFFQGDNKLFLQGDIKFHSLDTLQLWKICQSLLVFRKIVSSIHVRTYLSELTLSSLVQKSSHGNRWAVTSLRIPLLKNDSSEEIAVFISHFVRETTSSYCSDKESSAKSP